MAWIFDDNKSRTKIRRKYPPVSDSSKRTQLFYKIPTMDSSEIAAVYAEERKSCYALLATNDPDFKDSIDLTAPTTKDLRRRRRRARSWLGCCFTSRQDEELEENGHFVVLGWGSSTVAVIREIFFHLAGTCS